MVFGQFWKTTCKFQIVGQYLILSNFILQSTFFHGIVGSSKGIYDSKIYVWFVKLCLLKRREYLTLLYTSDKIFFQTCILSYSQNTFSSRQCFYWFNIHVVVKLCSTLNCIALFTMSNAQFWASSLNRNIFFL